jgi:hypothetical protein
LISCFPLALWLIRNHFLADNLTARPFSFHFSWQNLWILSKGTSLKTGAFLLADFPFTISGILISCWLILRRRKKQSPLLNSATSADPALKPESSSLVSLIAIFILCYIATLFLYMTLGSAEFQMSGRYLLPAFIAGIFLTFFAGYSRWIFGKLSNVYRSISIVIIVILCVAYLFQFTKFARYGRRAGFDFACRECRQSQLIRKVKELPSGTPIYSNWCPAIYLLAGRTSSFFPSTTNYFDHSVNQFYAEQLGKMKNTLQNQNGVIVYFRRLGHYSDRHTPRLNQIDPSLNLQVLFQHTEGSIYKLETSADTTGK